MERRITRRARSDDEETGSHHSTFAIGCRQGRPARNRRRWDDHLGGARHGRQKGHTEVYRGNEYTIDLLPKIKIETVLPDYLVDPAVQSFHKIARTGKIGDGKIFLSRVDEAIRIRNEERGDAAL